MYFSEILKHAPKYITIRYNSLNRHVWDQLFPEDERRRMFSRLHSKEQRKRLYQNMKSFSDEASLLVFIFVLKKVFSEGSKAAKDTVDTLKELGIEGFSLGKTFFSGRNENVVLGDILAEKLLSLLDENSIQLITKSNQIFEILMEYEIRKKMIYEDLSI